MKKEFEQIFRRPKFVNRFWKTSLLGGPSPEELNKTSEGQAKLEQLICLYNGSVHYAI